MVYYAHRNEQGDLQTLEEHALNVADLAGQFAAPFRSAEYAHILGLCHDGGKACEGFVKRLFHNGPKVDHSTFGAQLLDQKGARILAYAVAGHHGGMPNGGTINDSDGGVLALRLRKPLEYCDHTHSDYLNFSLPIIVPLQLETGSRIFATAFWVRMLYSCLVDGDFLDTESFMSGRQPRSQHYSLSDIQRMAQEYVKRFDRPTTAVHALRNNILHECLKGATLPPGLFTLTVPTGGGKTIASLCFALFHATEHRMQRVIYCMPYTSIIEQNGKVFQEMLESKNVLMHYADAFHDEYDASDADDGLLHRLAAENWDCPVIMTTNVQFFESLFSNKPAKCRKLHHIANSVIILDEAQMLPINYMQPSIRALEELCINYHCSVVFMSATQPSLSRFFTMRKPRRELNPIIEQSFAKLKRVRIQHQGTLAMQALADRLQTHNQAFCIVNSKARAFQLYSLLKCDYCYHLSTLMLPLDRERTLASIKERLKLGLPCLVVATSLIEAGVDFDFPVGYREQAGLDSIIQAAGRVNREGLRPYEDSCLYVFEVENARLHSEILQASIVSKYIFDTYEDVSSPEAISAYFDRLYTIRSTSTDQKSILDMLSDERGWSIPFETIAKSFKLIEENTLPVFILRDQQAQAIAQQLRNGERNRALLRSAMRYCVMVRPAELKAIELVVQPISSDEDMYILSEDVCACIERGDIPQHYSLQTGLCVQATQGGEGTFI